MVNWKEDAKVDALLKSLEAIDTAYNSRGFLTGGDIKIIYSTLSRLKDYCGGDVDELAAQWKHRINTQFAARQGGQL